MKLSTILHNGKLWCLVNAFYERGADKGVDCIAHDAVVAHALVQAMKEMDFDAFCTPVQALSQRANELMKEWGFGDGCG